MGDSPLLFGERFADFWLERIANSIPVVALMCSRGCNPCLGWQGAALRAHLWCVWVKAVPHSSFPQFPVSGVS